MNLRNKLDDCVFRLKRVTGETMAGTEHQIGRCVPAPTICPETIDGRKTRATVHDSSVQMKPDEQAEESESIDDFEGISSVGNARSRP